MTLIWSTVLAWIITTVALWWGARLLSVDLTLRQAAMVCAVTNLCELIPYAGWPLAIIIMFGALKWITQEPMWPVIGTLAGLTLVLTMLIAFMVGSLSRAVA
jgi:hypothetical protein